VKARAAHHHAVAEAFADVVRGEIAVARIGLLRLRRRWAPGRCAALSLRGATRFAEDPLPQRLRRPIDQIEFVPPRLRRTRWPAFAERAQAEHRDQGFDVEQAELSGCFAIPKTERAFKVLRIWHCEWRAVLRISPLSMTGVIVARGTAFNRRIPPQ